MHISRMQLRNFRNFRNAEFRFSKGVNTLIGENGSGKTNAFHAIRLLLDDSLSRRATQLREADFNRAKGSWKGQWIIISIDFANLDTSEGCQILKHAMGHMTGSNSGTYTYFFRPNREVRKALFDTSRSNPGDLPSMVDSIQIDQYEACFTGRATADFCNDQTFSAIAGNIESGQFPDPDLDDSALLGTRVFQQIHTEVSCTFIKALRDVVNDLRNYRDSPLLSLLRGAEKGIELVDSKRITDAIAVLNDDISSLDEIRGLSLSIQDSLHDTVGYSYAPAIDIKSSLPSDIERLLQSLSLRVSDPLDEGYEGDLTELSLGGANLIYLSLKLLEYEMKVSSDRVAHFLLIEEPESHIHTHIQKTLFEKYGYKQTQVIVSTHSTHISAASKIRSVNVLAKSKQHAVVFHPSNNLSPDECDRIERYLDAVRSTLLFAKGVILVEGDAELILLPTLVKTVLGVSLDELGLSLISMSSAIFTNVAKVFHDDRIRRCCAIVTDEDAEFITLPVDPKLDSPDQKDARASKKAGEERMAALSLLCNGNDWIKPFYAKHTFEVDFFRENGNTNYIVKSLDSIFLQQAAIERSKTALESASAEISGTEVLRLAKKVGKGWFALQLAAEVDAGTTIPHYILNAIAFACGHTLDLRTIHLMLRHRLKHYESLGHDIEQLKHCFTTNPSEVTLPILSKDLRALATLHNNDPLVTIFGRVAF